MEVQSQFIEMFGTIDEPKVEVKKLIDVVLSSGQYGSNTSATDYQQGKPRYIRITDINDDGSLNEDIKTAEVIEDKYKLVPGDLVFARTGATVGKTYLHESGDAIYAGYLIKYQMNESLMRPAFMKAFTHSKTYYNWVANSQKVGAQPNISATQYDNMPVLVPQIERQDEFLAIYNQADKSKFVGFKSQFIEMFDLSGNSKHWPVLKFNDFATLDCKMTTDFEFFANHPHIGIDSIEQNTGRLYGYRTVSEDNVKSGKYIFTPKHIIYSKIRPNLNKVAIPDFEGLCSADSYPVLANEKVTSRVFLAFLMRSEVFLDYIVPLSNRTGMPKANRDQVEGFTCPMPPKTEQDRFVAILEQADKSKYYNQVA